MSVFNAVTNQIARYRAVKNRIMISLADSKNPLVKCTCRIVPLTQALKLGIVLLIKNKTSVGIFVLTESLTETASTPKVLLT